MAIKTADGAAEARGFARVFVGACGSHMLGAATRKAAKPAWVTPHPPITMWPSVQGLL